MPQELMCATKIPTPIGAIEIIARNAGILAIHLPGVDTRANEAWIQQHIHVPTTSVDFDSDPTSLAEEHIWQTREEISNYFAAKKTGFSLALDLSYASQFARNVLGVLQKIPYGQTRSYAQIAMQAGAPGAARAAGTVCARNRHPLVIPCHRVVRADGSFGEYAGGVAMKTTLLQHENPEIIP